MKVVFMGTPQAAVPCLRRLLADGHEVVAVYTQPDRPAGRGRQLSPPPVKEFAHSQGIAIFQPEKIKNEEECARFRSLGADIAVVVAYGRILPSEFLTAFPKGAVNIHFSLLPKYRGAAPVNWAIVNREVETGVTSMLMDEGLDTGNILLQESTLILRDETSTQLLERLAVMGADVLSKTLSQYESISPRRQVNADATFAPILKKSDGLIDFSSDADTIEARIRGFQPFPSSFAMLDGKKLTIWKCSAAEGVPNMGPGTVISSDEGKLLVSAGKGTALSIEELQLEGKKRLTTPEFLNGHKLPAGTVLEGAKS